MKSINLFILVISSLLSFESMARSPKRPDPTPIKSKVVLKNSDFAKLIVDAIKDRASKKFIQRAGGSSTEYSVGKGLICRENVGLGGGGKRSYSYDCALRATGIWKTHGDKVYGTGTNEQFANELFDALDIDKEVEAGTAFKTIALDLPDGDGGTERNLLACNKPLTEENRKYFRATCEILDAL